MTPEMMVKIGLVVGKLFSQSPSGVIIGRDSRLSGQMLECALSSGLAASGTNVWLAGIIPTPAVAFLTRVQNVLAGIVISASHNPASDNGIKIFSNDGFKLPDELEGNIEEGLLGDPFPTQRPTGSEIGKIHSLSGAKEQYLEHTLHSVFSEDLPNLRGMKIVVDCANGAASFVAPEALKRLQADVVELSVTPDGLNINFECGALHTETLQSRVLQERADLGVAFDGDADRLILVDEHGESVDGDRILAMLALDLLHTQQLRDNTLVTTVMSNLGLEVSMKEAGIRLIRTGVGDRYVVEKMREIGANLGGEQSGHVVMFDHGTTGDGLAATLAVLKILQASNRPLSELAACIEHFPQTLLNVPVKERKPIEEMGEVSQAIRYAEQELGDRGRILVRYSGTELLARVMVEAEDEQTVIQIAETIAEEFRKENQF
jgi:phosphoglucosamine mutase